VGSDRRAGITANDFPGQRSSEVRAMRLQVGRGDWGYRHVGPIPGQRYNRKVRLAPGIVYHGRIAGEEQIQATRIERGAKVEEITLINAGWENLDSGQPGARQDGRRDRQSRLGEGGRDVPKGRIEPHGKLVRGGRPCLQDWRPGPQSPIPPQIPLRKEGCGPDGRIEREGPGGSRGIPGPASGQGRVNPAFTVHPDEGLPGQAKEKAATFVFPLAEPDIDRVQARSGSGGHAAGIAAPGNGTSCRRTAGEGEERGPPPVLQGQRDHPVVSP